MTLPAPERCAACALAVALAGALGCDREPTPTRATLDVKKAALVFREVPLETANGLSGLAADDTGALWTVAERALAIYRIELRPETQPAIETFSVTGLPDRTDLEAIAVLGGGQFALGTEGRVDGAATVFTAEQRGTTIAITGTIPIPAARVGVELWDNHGAEGVCGAGDTIIAAIESTATEGMRRWAPVVRIDRGAISHVYQLVLTSRTGKIAGLDCRIAADGTVTAWAIERHFEVTALLRFVLPPRAAPNAFIYPEVMLDLGPVLHGSLNLEGIAALPDGRVVAVVDNQWKKVTGPSELLVFTPDAFRRAP